MVFYNMTDNKPITATTNTNTNKSIEIQIQTIFDTNKINDLNRFLHKRQCLNTTNSYFNYLFHLVQSAGILTTSIAAGNNNTEMVWIGVGLNILATLINVYEKANNSISTKLLQDIKLIKEGKYVDEGVLIETDVRHDNNAPTQQASAQQASAQQASAQQASGTKSYQTFSSA